MTNAELINVMADKFYNLIMLSYMFRGDAQQSIEYAKQKSCAGSAAREIAISRFNQTIKA